MIMSPYLGVYMDIAKLPTGWYVSVEQIVSVLLGVLAA